MPLNREPFYRYIVIGIHDDDKKEINRYELDPAEGTYGVNIPRGQWHTIEVLCAGTVIFEVKDGPYIPIAPNDMLE